MTSRNTVQVKQGDKVVAQTTDCPGVHGEATAAESGGPVMVVDSAIRTRRPCS